MATSRIVMWFREEDYETIRTLVPGEPDLPDTFDEWHQSALKIIEKLESLGIAPRKTVIDPKQFVAYCRASGIDHSIYTLQAFAVVTDRINSERRA